MFKSLRYWQKGIVYSIIFTILLSAVYAGAMVAFEYQIDSKGGPHICSEGRICALDESVRERIGLMPAIFAVLGIPLCLLAFSAGLLMDKFFPEV